MTMQEVADELKARVAAKQLPLNVAAGTLFNWAQENDHSITRQGAESMVDPNAVSSNERGQPMNEVPEPPLEELP